LFFVVEVPTAVIMKNAVFWDVADSFYLEGGGDTSLRNVGSNKTHTAPHPRRRHFY
jgi:hypothetical protein